MSGADLQMTIAGVTFDRVLYDADADVLYDADADVLYLHLGDPSTAVAFDESPEGHHLRFDASGKLVGITMVGVRKDFEIGGKVTVTVPEFIEIGEKELRRVLEAA